jgi:WD40 repeat protein
MKAAVLRVFYAALMREAHRLTAQPEIYWQQIFNRLQWEGSEVRQQLEAEYQKRTRAGSKAWLRTRMPVRESRFLIRTLAGHSSGVNSCTVGRDGRTLVSGSDDYSVNIWDLTTGQVRLTLLGSPGPVTSCAVSADGSLVVAADLTGSICAWSALTGELYYTLATNEVAIYGCDFSPDDRLLATACADGVVRLWNLEQRRIVAEMPGHEREVHDCKFMPDGEHLVSAGEDGTLRLWNTQAPAAVASLKATSWHSLRACAVSRSGRLVAAVDDRAVLTVWDINSRSIVCESRKDAGHHPFYWAAPGRSGVLGCAIDPNEKFAVSPGYDRTLSVWEIPSGKALASLEGHTGWVKSCAITADGQVLVSACSDHTLMLWDLSSLQGSGGSGRFLRYQPIKGCAFSADGWRAVSTCEDKSLTVWDVNQNTELRTFSGHHYNDFLDCAIDPEGKVVVTTSTDNTLVVRDIENGALVATLTGHDLAEYPYFGVYAC